MRHLPGSREISPFRDSLRRERSSATCAIACASSFRIGSAHAKSHGSGHYAAGSARVLLAGERESRRACSRASTGGPAAPRAVRAGPDERLWPGGRSGYAGGTVWAKGEAA